MGIIAEAWGLNNTLVPFTEDNGMAWEGKSTSGPMSPIDPAILGDRTELLYEDDGSQFYRIRRHTNDSLTPVRPRTEIFHPDIHAQIADWTTLGEPGANIDQSKRWYIYGIRLPDKAYLPTGYLNKPASSSPFCILMQAGQRYDTTPEDTAGPPPLALHLKKTPFDVEYLSFSRFVDPNSLTTVNEDGDSQILLNLPFVWNLWYYFIIYVQWSYTTLGAMTIWHDGKKLLTEAAAPNCVNNSWTRGGGSQKFKNGIYAGPYSACNQEFMMDTRGIVILDHTATLEDALAYLNMREHQLAVTNKAFL